MKVNVSINRANRIITGPMAILLVKSRHKHHKNTHLCIQKLYLQPSLLSSPMLNLDSLTPISPMCHLVIAETRLHHNANQRRDADPSAIAHRRST